MTTLRAEFQRAERMLLRAVAAETESAALRAELRAARVALGVDADAYKAFSGVSVLNTADSVTPVGKPNMVMRSLRVPEKLWEAAKAKADEREENVSDVLREALERYVRRR